MPLFRKKDSVFWWYTITVDGTRYRRSTGKKTRAAAATVEAKALTELIERSVKPESPRRKPTLRELAPRFLEWVEATRELDEDTRRYYRYGWRLVNMTALATMRVDCITKDNIDCTEFSRPVYDRKRKAYTSEVVPCSAAYTAQALRTLKVMLGKAEEDWGLITRRPRFRIAKVAGRKQLITDDIEAKLQAAILKPTNHRAVAEARQRAWLFFVILMDAGVRPDECKRIAIPDIHWMDRRIRIHEGKTENAERWVTISERMLTLMRAWVGDRKEGKLFPSARAKDGRLTSIATLFRRARKEAGLPMSVVAYCARHTFGTYTMKTTKNTFAVQKSMGHADVNSMVPYQHQEIDELVEAIDLRNRAKDFGHSFGHSTSLIQ